PAGGGNSSGRRGAHSPWPGSGSASIAGYGVTAAVSSSSDPRSPPSAPDRRAAPSPNAATVPRHWGGTFSSSAGDEPITARPTVRVTASITRRTSARVSGWARRRLLTAGPRGRVGGGGASGPLGR